MNQELWEKILAFDLDSPPSEYGFPTRLANEQYWTSLFTQEAILEYKKFMYLAATSDFMVSPSKIVDSVWHQHLIFTHSYQEFCLLLGKQIQHIPSTHNREEFEKFKQAKERTKKLYLHEFGQQPAAIWEYEGMYESLHLEKAKFKLRTIIIIGILVFLLLLIPGYFFLRPIYIRIDNPYFIIGMIGLTTLTFLILEFFNLYKLNQIKNEFYKSSFIYHLQPMELVYLQTGKLSNVINGTVNELVETGTIKINADNTIELTTKGGTNSIEQLQTINTLNSLGKTFYPTLLNLLATKPVFDNTAKCMDAFIKYFNKSKKFARLFYINFGVLLLLLMLAITRLITGLLRDKPIDEIGIAILVLAAVIILYLERLTKLIHTKIIPDVYKNIILPGGQVENTWQWNYFLLGTAVLSSSFISLAERVGKTEDGGSSGGHSCGSSCGSSCSSCGGCGGGD